MGYVRQISVRAIFAPRVDPASPRRPELFAVRATDQIVRRDLLADTAGSPEIGRFSTPFSSFTKAACVDSIRAASCARGSGFFDTNTATKRLGNSSSSG